jgi:hypothetical protein
MQNKYIGVLSLREKDNRKDSARKTNTQVYFCFTKRIIKRIALALWQHLTTLDSRLPSLAVRAPLWLLVGGVLDQMKMRLTQPQVELGKNAIDKNVEVVFH